MREIKFRGLCNEEVHTHHEATELGKFVYGYLVNPYTIRTTMSQESGGMGSGFVEVDVEVIPESVGQFTGMKDKKGVEIFDNDIIIQDSKNCDGTINRDKYQVVFSKGRIMAKAFESCLVKKGCLIAIYDGCEVIGNVHEN